MKETLKEIALDIASAVDFFLGSCVCACVRVRVFVVFVFGVCARARLALDAGCVLGGYMRVVDMA